MITNKKIKFIKGLSIKKNRLKERCFIVEGEKIINELIKSSYNIIELYATKDWVSKNKYLGACQVSNYQLDRISGMKSANNVLAIVEYRNISNIPIYGNKLVIDNIKDPGNLGTIIRTCDWFGIRDIVCSKNTVDIYNPKVVQSTMGSLFRVNVYYVDLNIYLSKVQNHIYGAYTSGKDIRSVKASKDFHLVVGNESRGISCDLSRYINTNVSISSNSDLTDSLNVAAATSIILHSFCN